MSFLGKKTRKSLYVYASFIKGEFGCPWIWLNCINIRIYHLEWAMKNEAITVMDGISHFCFMKCPHFKFIVMMVMILESPIQNFLFVHWKYRNVIKFHGGNQMNPKCVFSFQLFSMCLCTSSRISTPFFFFGLFSNTKWVLSFLKKKNRFLLQFLFERALQVLYSCLCFCFA